VPGNEVSQDFYTQASNVVFRSGFAERLGGSREVYAQNTENPVFHLLNVRAPGGITESNFWLSFGLAHIQALETSNITDITGAALQTVTHPWQWSSTLLNNIPCFNNGLDPPRYWAGDVGTPAADLPGWPAGTVCKFLIAFKFHLFALDIDGPSGHFESQFLWSDAAAPGNVPSTWTASATNQAGDDVVADKPGPCMTAVALQDTLLIFKRSSVYAVNFIGGNDIFTVKLLDGVRGALTRHSAVDIGGAILVVCDGDICVTDGVSWESVGNTFDRSSGQPVSTVRDYLFSQLDQASYENLHCVYNQAHDEVEIRYPTTGNTYCNEALVFNRRTGDWGIRSLDETTCAAIGVVNDTAPDESWNGDAQAWDADATFWNAANFSLATEQLVTGSNSADLTLEDSGDAVTVAATLFRHDLAMGEPERLKMVRRVHVRTNATPGTLFVRVGSRNSVTDSITYDSEQQLDTPDAFINVMTLGRFITVEVRSAGTEVWKVAGVDMEYEARGYH
jgi:hypothetical protein